MGLVPKGRLFLPKTWPLAKVPEESRKGFEVHLCKDEALDLKETLCLFQLVLLHY